jgi:ATP-dependent protease HslVU (ClpYQ) peptidase subunit
MTCIVTYIDGNAVVMGGDTVCSEGEYITNREGTPKIWKEYNGIEEFLIGFAGNCGELSYLRYSFEWPIRKLDESLERWINNSVSPRLQNKFKKRFENRPQAIESEWEILIAFKGGRVFRISICGDVEETRECYNAIGSGRYLALSCIEALHRNCKEKLVSWEFVEEALKISERFMGGSVRGPFNYLSIV